MSQTQALILGSTGCIGNNIVRACLEAGWAVRAFHRASSQTWMLEGLDAHGPQGIEHAIGDLDDPASLVAAMRGCDVVFHAAAYYPRHSLDMAGSLREAVTGMRNVLRAFAAGGNPQEVAEALCITLVTVDSHKTVILDECRNAWQMEEGAYLNYHFLREKFGRFCGDMGKHNISQAG